MSRRTVLLSSLAGVAVATSGLLSAGAGATATSEYKTPAAGKWKIQDKFDETVGGSMTVAKGATKLSVLSLNPGPDSVADCGGTAPVVLAKPVPIKRVGSYKRPVVGKLPKGGVIEQTSVQVTLNGTKQPAKLEVIFEKDGRTAFTARLTVGECNLNFAARK